MTNTQYAEAIKSEQAEYLICGTTDAEYNAMAYEEVHEAEISMIQTTGYVLH